MQRRFWLLAIVLVWSTVRVDAAITAATFQGSEPIGPDVYRARIRLVTNDVRGTYDAWFIVRGQTAQEVRDDASRQIATLNQTWVTRDVLANVAIGTNIPVTAPAPPARTAYQVWEEKARRLERLKRLGLTNATAVSEINALEADVNATYVSGYVANF